MGIQELEECLNLLVGDGNFKTALPVEMTSDDFAENVLGFEEVEELEDDGQNGEGMQQEYMGASYSRGLGTGLYNEVIPEENI